MYIFPGYVDHWEEDHAIYITSRLRQNTVKLTEPDLIDEFREIFRCGGCPEISTQLSQFLHEQELLVNEQEIEASILELRRTMNDVLLLTIMPTEGCNFRCPYCYEDHAPISMRREILNQIHTYISEQATNFKYISVAWFGGEPTLCKDVILETNEMMQSLQKQHAFHFASGMTTNGYLMSLEDFKQYFRAGITSYQITLDGWDHDQTRPHITGKGTLNRILDNLIAISSLPREEYPFHIVIRHNILPQDEDLSWYDYLFKLFGGDERFSVLIRPVSDWGGDTVKSLEILDGGNAMAHIKKHVDYVRKIGLPCKNGKKNLLSQICYASYPHSMVFRSNGKIEKCTICLDHPKNLLGYVDSDEGIILDDSINRLWSESELKPECKKCRDVLSCLNMQCKKGMIIDGGSEFRCSCSVSDLF